MFKKKIFTLLSVVMMAVMVGASVMPVLTAFAVTNTRSEDLIFQKDSTGNVVAILSKNGLITPIGNVLVIYNASGVATGIKTIYGEVISIGSSYTPSLATTSASGVVQPDGTSITISASGVISSTASGAAAAEALTGTALASNVIYSSMVSAAGGNFGTAAYTASTAYLGATSNAASASAVPATGITGNTLASNVTTSSLLSAAGGSFNTGAFTAAYTLPVATSSVSGGVKVDGTSITISNGIISSTASGAADAGSLTGTTLASNVVNSSLTSAASGVLGTSAYVAAQTYGTGTSTALTYAVNAANGMPRLDTSAKILEAQLPSSVLSITCAASAANDTYYYISAASGVGCTHHPVAQSSAATTVTLDTTFINTTTPNYSTGASAAVWTVPLAASMPANVGDEIYIFQSGVGAVSVSGVAGVTVMSESSYLTLQGQNAIGVLKNLAANVWGFFGNRK